ncbi:MAG: hypothetical protein KDB68_08835 [Planctomycetes bacterium]|nr:hypothetical protein [Planctomycetota bacterium]
MTKLRLTYLSLMIAVLFASACSDVPGNTLDGAPGGDSKVPTGTLGDHGQDDAAHYEKLVREARGAFLDDPRKIEEVELSAELYQRATEIRADEYLVLWEAARTCVWLGNYGPEDKQKDYVMQGITYANTALKVKPDGPEALFYDGALAGKLAELDISYGADGLKTLMSRMKQLVDMDSKYIYDAPDRVLGITYMRAPGSPIGPGDWDKAEGHLTRALKYDPNWPENQLYMAELEFSLADERDKPELAERARKRLNEHILSEDAVAPMGSKFEFKKWQEEARKLIEDNK